MSTLVNQISEYRLEIIRLEAEKELLHLRRDAMDLNVSCLESDKIEVDREITQRSDQINRLCTESARLEASYIVTEHGHRLAEHSDLLVELSLFSRPGGDLASLFHGEPRGSTERLEYRRAGLIRTVDPRFVHEVDGVDDPYNQYDGYSDDDYEEYEETPEEVLQRRLDGIPDFSLGCVKGETWGSAHNLETLFEGRMRAKGT